MLFNAVLVVGHGGDLRQMGDAEYLAIPCDIRHFLRDYLGCAPGNAGVDFVKYHRRNLALPGGKGFDRQHDAGKLAAGSGLRQRLEGLSPVGGDQENRLIHPRGRRSAF